MYIQTRCPTCNEQIKTQCCLQRHANDCNGRSFCYKCSQLIVARGGEDLAEKKKAHVCDLRKCLICFEDLYPSDAKTHCYKLRPFVFPKEYPQLGFFDLESFVEKDGKVRDMVLTFQTSWKSMRLPLTTCQAKCQTILIWSKGHFGPKKRKEPKKESWMKWRKKSLKIQTLTMPIRICLPF